MGNPRPGSRRGGHASTGPGRRAGRARGTAGARSAASSAGDRDLAEALSASWTQATAIDPARWRPGCGTQGRWPSARRSRAFTQISIRAGSMRGPDRGRARRRAWSGGWLSDSRGADAPPGRDRRGLPCSAAVCSRREGSRASGQRPCLDVPDATSPMHRARSLRASSPFVRDVDDGDGDDPASEEAVTGTSRREDGFLAVAVESPSILARACCGVLVRMEGGRSCAAFGGPARSRGADSSGARVLERLAHRQPRGKT